MRLAKMRQRTKSRDYMEAWTIVSTHGGIVTAMHDRRRWRRGKAYLRECLLVTNCVDLAAELRAMFPVSSMTMDLELRSATL